jgi:hypothetical protein
MILSSLHNNLLLRLKLNKDVIKTGADPENH